MKMLYKPMSFLFAVFVLSSCSKNKEGVEVIEEGKRPFVDYEIVKGDDPLTFDFVNKSSNYKSLLWRFGDDSVSTEVTTKHVYMTTGKFDVSLTATSETGATARKLLSINIDPDSVVKLSAPATDVRNQVKFNIESKANIASTLWTFEDKSTSTDLSPLRTYREGTLNPLSLKVTTNKGSVINLSKYATTAGIVSNVTNKVSMSVSSDNGGGKNANEGSLKLLDGDVNTKMYQGWPGTFTATFTFAAAQTIKFYGIGSANDSPTRDPKVWTLEGSNDGNNWEVLDTRNLDRNFYDQAGSKYKQMFYFAVATPKPFPMYRWKVTANFGSGGFQLSEFQLFR